MPQMLGPGVLESNRWRDPLPSIKGPWRSELPQVSQFVKQTKGRAEDTGKSRGQMLLTMWRKLNLLKVPVSFKIFDK